MAETTVEDLRERSPVEDQVQVNGLQSYAGYISEDRDLNIPELASLYIRTREYNKMMRDPSIQAIVGTITSTLATADWSLEAASDDPEAIKAKNFVESCMDDISIGDWHTMMYQVIHNMIHQGFTIVSPNYKIRRGADFDDPMFQSQYSDKKIGWKSFSQINHTSIDRWILPDNEGVNALEGVLLRASNGIISTVPRNRMALFQYAPMQNPESYSILRGIHQSWFQMERLNQIDVVSFERSLVGIPVARCPQEYLKENATPDQMAAVRYLKTVVTQLKRNHQTGLILPSDTNESGNRLLDIELMGAPGGSSDSEALLTKIQDLRSQMMSGALLQFQTLGQNSSIGSFALSNTGASVFYRSVGVIARNIQSVVNRELIRPLLKLNGIPAQHHPKIVYEKIAVQSDGDFIKAVVDAINASAVTVDENLEKVIRQRLNLPPIQTDDADIGFDIGSVDDLRELETDQNEAIEEAAEKPPSLAETVAEFTVDG